MRADNAGFPFQRHFQSTFGSDEQMGISVQPGVGGVIERKPFPWREGLHISQCRLSVGADPERRDPVVDIRDRVVDEIVVVEEIDDCRGFERRDMAVHQLFYVPRAVTADAGIEQLQARVGGFRRLL